MGTQQQDIREMKRLLRYANYRKVGDAVGVERATVSNWARGNDVTPARLTQVRELMLTTVGRRKRTAAPDLPGRLDEIEQKLDVLTAALTPLDRFAYVDQLVGRLEELLRPPAEDPPAKTEESGQAGVVPPDRGAE